MASWTLVLADEDGNSLQDTRASAQLSFVRNAAAQVTFTVDLEDEASLALVAALRNGIPKLRAYRDGTLVFNGQWAPMEEESVDSDAPTADLRAVFRSPFDVLVSRFSDPHVVFTASDAGQIAWALIAIEIAASPMGYKAGTIEATKLRDRTYEHKQIAEAVVELTAVDGGFDFVERYVDEGRTLAAFDIVARQGEEQVDAVFEHGPGTLANVARVVRRWLPPVNRARVLGESGIYGEKYDLSSISTYGERMVVVSTSNVAEPSTLDDKAIALLRPNPIEIVEFEPDPLLAPQPWDDYWLGDTVPIRCRLGSLSFETTARINGITVTIDEEGNEAQHMLTFESPTSEVA